MDGRRKLDIRLPLIDAGLVGLGVVIDFIMNIVKPWPQTPKAKNPKGLGNDTKIFSSLLLNPPSSH